MKQKDFLVTITVLGRVMHRIIVRAVTDAAAAHIAKFIAKDLNEMTKEEVEHAACSVELFTYLDNDEFFVCF